ncbi:hypothetical protein SERLADRAFT_440676 [Serpula lacrymans var. lacrymans S7.9]|uniref:Uncharacterized protein n=1 Tax=Serpula lacrymans var. lacrymans (strain S7.9) TaxID=578457 RepID=F8P3C5_SERL9|nr:uncharacterized protein SERLADRAFT_440676 [Serpula lacrymans var. lacrymans S7.9]EGO22656.1 hypothetical protein SERLADRAFT_440676 [Serpula lacrymans var. lacrymans S7.9]
MSSIAAPQASNIFQAPTAVQTAGVAQNNPIHRQLLTEHILHELSQAEIGYAMLCIGGTDNDLGTGPNLIKQFYNPRPINQVTLKSISTYAKAKALLNHYEDKAITIGVHHQHIAGGIEPSNGGAEMHLFNGNHRVQYMKTQHAKAFYDLQQAKMQVIAAQDDLTRDVAEAEAATLTAYVRDHSIWLVKFYDIDVINASANRTLLLHELTANDSAPGRDNTDTEKYKNLLRLYRDCKPEEKAELCTQVSTMWAQAKERMSSGSRPAWAVNYNKLFDFMVDLYAVKEFEESRHTSMNIALFTPMLKMLHFLVSPVKMLNLDQYTFNVLRKPFNLQAYPGERQQVLDAAHLEFVSQIISPEVEPYLSLLSSGILTVIDSSFSTQLSAGMCYYGSVEPGETEVYETAYKQYWATAITAVEKIIPELRPCDSSSLIAIILDNMVTKMQWLRTGFMPFKGPHLDLTTLPPVLTPHVFPSLTSVWETKGLPPRDPKDEVLLAICMGQDKISDLCSAVNKPMVTAINTFLHGWSKELSLLGNTAEYLILPEASKALIKSCRAELPTKDQEKGLYAVHQLLRVSGFPWRTNLPVGCGLIQHLITQNIHCANNKDTLKFNIIWDLRRDLTKCMSEIYKDLGLEDEGYYWWDGIVEQPEFEENDHMKDLLPSMNRVESIAMTSARTLKGSTLEDRNIQSMLEIIQIASRPELGGFKLGGNLMLDPEVKNALTEFIQVLGGVSDKQHIRVREPTEDLTAPYTKAQQVKAIRSNGLQRELDDLRIASSEEAKLYWRGRKDNELKYTKALQSTSTLALNEEVMKKHLAEAKKKTWEEKQLKRSTLRVTPLLANAAAVVAPTAVAPQAPITQNAVNVSEPSLSTLQSDTGASSFKRSTPYDFDSEERVSKRSRGGVDHNLAEELAKRFNNLSTIKQAGPKLKVSWIAVKNHVGLKRRPANLDKFPILWQEVIKMALANTSKSCHTYLTNFCKHQVNAPADATMVDLLGTYTSNTNIGHIARETLHLYSTTTTSAPNPVSQLGQSSATEAATTVPSGDKGKGKAREDIVMNIMQPSQVPKDIDMEEANDVHNGDNEIEEEEDDNADGDMDFSGEDNDEDNVSYEVEYGPDPGSD